MAAHQFGVVTVAQLADAGLGRSAIARRVQAGRLHRLHVGVYAVGHTALAAAGRRLAAVLACGEQAVASHRSAAALWGLRPDHRARIDVTVPRGAARSRGSIVVHGVRSLQPADVAVAGGIPVTSVARTALDLAEDLSRSSLERLLREAEVLRLLDMGALTATMARNPGRRGLRNLTAVVAGLAGDPPDPNALQRAFADLCRAAGLPEPVRQVRIGQYVVDFAWPASRFVVETDGRAFHAIRAAFERDRVRDLELTAAGWTVMRLSWRQVMTPPSELVPTLRARLT